MQIQIKKSAENWESKELKNAQDYMFGIFQFGKHALPS